MQEKIEIKTGADTVTVRKQGFAEAIQTAFKKGQELPKGAFCEARVWNEEINITFTWFTYKEAFRNSWIKIVDKIATKLKGR